VRPHEYLLVLLRNWLVIGVTVLLGILVGLGVSMAMPKAYGATAQVLFTGHAGTNGQDLAYVGSYTQGRLSTYQRLAESNSVLTLVKRDLGSKEKTSHLRSRIDLSTVQNTSIVAIKTTDATRRGALATAASVATRLRTTVEALENGTAASSKAFVTATIIGAPESPAAPVSPKLPLNLLVGALAGLAVSVGVVTVREALRAGRDGAAEVA
jgi:capsular polysaccharide biosynthesis protein